MRMLSIPVFHQIGVKPCCRFVVFGIQKGNASRRVPDFSLFQVIAREV